MDKENLTVINYRNYADSVWKGNTSQQKKYRDIWLSSQNKTLPRGFLKKDYKIRIKELRKEIDYKSEEIEKKLLKQRFSFSSEIDSKLYSYRELITLAKDEKINIGIQQALIEEANLLVDSGFTELIRYRNKSAKHHGYRNYWEMVNYTQKDFLSFFLRQLDLDLKKIPVKLLPPTLRSSLQIDLGEALAFFASLLFVRTKIPPIEIKIRKGSDCPPGPAYVQTLEYRPEKGHILGINLPFVHQNRLKREDLGVLFHELTHLFHFASLDYRGNHAFPAELASNNLLYESEALCYQSLTLSAWKGAPYIPDLWMLKDLVYLAETERQLYSMDIINSENIKELIMGRITEHYPDGNFRRTPLGASHLISGELAGQYWIYPAAHWRSFQRISDILGTEKFLTVPSFWIEGNEASFRLQMDNLHKEGNIYPFVATENLMEPQKLQRREREDIIDELNETGLYARFLS